MGDRRTGSSARTDAPLSHRQVAVAVEVGSVAPEAVALAEHYGEAMAVARKKYPGLSDEDHLDIV